MNLLIGIGSALLTFLSLLIACMTLYVELDHLRRRTRKGFSYEPNLKRGGIFLAATLVFISVGYFTYYWGTNTLEYSL